MSAQIVGSGILDITKRNQTTVNIYEQHHNNEENHILQGLQCQPPEAYERRGDLLLRPRDQSAECGTATQLLLGVRYVQ